MEVSRHAVLLLDYWTAIRAAEATPYNNEQASNLSFVVRCAIEDGEYDLAAEAASRINYSSNRDRMLNQAINAQRLAISESKPSPQNRESMSCFK